jgi:hypothetical protein
MEAAGGCRNPSKLRVRGLFVGARHVVPAVLTPSDKPASERPASVRKFFVYPPQCQKRGQLNRAPDNLTGKTVAYIERSYTD